MVRFQRHVKVVREILGDEARLFRDEIEEAVSDGKSCQSRSAEKNRKIAIQKLLVLDVGF